MKIFFYSEYIRYRYSFCLSKRSSPDIFNRAMYTMSIKKTTIVFLREQTVLAFPCLRKVANSLDLGDLREIML